MEMIISEDETDERTKKMKERFDQYSAQQFDDGDLNKESAGDPRLDAPGGVPHKNLVIMKYAKQYPINMTLAAP